MRKHERDYGVSSSIAKKHKTDENPKEVQPTLPKSKHKHGDFGDSSSIAKKKPKTEVEVSSSGEGNPLACLPPDVSFMILDKLFEPTDHLSFARVCKDWCSISRNYNIATQRWHKKGKLLPLFLVSTESESKGTTSNHELEAYNVSSGKRCYDNIHFPVTHGKRCCGSSHGWLAILDIEDICLSITLVHPFQKSVEAIKLPLLDFMMTKSLQYYDINHFKNNYQEYIRKVILSSNPILNRDSYVVVVLYGYGGSKLAFIKGGQQRWTYPDRRQSCLKDAIFYRNQVYAVGGSDGNEKIISFDVNSCNKPSKPPKANQRTPNNVLKKCAASSYLVESVEGDHLWHVRRLVSYSRRADKYIERFMVYKVVFDDKDGSVVEQVEVQSIGDEALFVGASHSISVVLASNFPGCKPNSIYYATEEPYCFEDPDHKTYHISSLDDGTITEYEQNLRRHRSLHLEIPCGVWVLPMFKGLF
ncbi:putative F-box protein [Rosa sericea]